MIRVFVLYILVNVNIKTWINYYNDEIISIQYHYYSIQHVYLCKLIVDFNMSDCNPAYIKVEPLSQQNEIEELHKLDYRPRIIYTY